MHWQCMVALYNVGYDLYGCPVALNLGRLMLYLQILNQAENGLAYSVRASRMKEKVFLHSYLFVGLSEKKIRNALKWALAQIFI